MTTRGRRPGVSLIAPRRCGAYLDPGYGRAAGRTHNSQAGALARRPRMLRWVKGATHPMSKLLRGVAAGYGAKKLGGGCFSTIIVFILLWSLLGNFKIFQ